MYPGSRILELQKEAADAHKETIRVRNYWFQVLEDMLLEFEKMQKKTKQELQEMEKRALKAEKQREHSFFYWKFAINCQTTVA